MGVRQKVIEVLEEERLPFTPTRIEWVICEHGIGVNDDPKVFIEEIVAEGARRSLEAIERFLGSLGIRDLPPEVEERLRKGETVSVRFFEGEAMILAVSGRVEELVSLPLPRDREVPVGVGLDVEEGLAILRVESKLEAVRGKALFRSHRKEDIEKVIDRLKPLASFLPATGLEDLPQALERLRALDMWESRIEDSYVLARGGGLWTLRKGPIFGDPELDGALLLEREVNLSFPEGVEISFSFFWGTDVALITDLEIAWKGEVVRLGETLNEYANFPAHPLEGDFVTKSIKNLLRYELDRLEERSRTPASEEDPRYPSKMPPRGCWPS
jgi:hypothetical protein